jgi:hypothetical protein
MMPQETDYTFMATRPSVVNHLKNGGFFVYRSFTALNFYPSTSKISKVFRTQYTYIVSDPDPPTASTAVPFVVPGFMVEASPSKENFAGYWDVWGSQARVLFNESKKSLDGGNLVTVRFTVDGEVTFRQGIDSFNKFRGKPVTLALTGVQETGDIKVVLKLGVGTKTLESRPFFSIRFGTYQRMIVSFDVPLDISKFEVLVVLSGKAGYSTSFSGASLCIGAYSGDLPFSESLPDLSLPSGTVVGWVGESCPAGFRSLKEEDYLFPVLGDPNAVRGNLYTRATSGGSLNSMGAKGKLTVGENMHRHDTVLADPGKVVNGLAFEPPGGSDSIIEANNSQVYDPRMRNDLAPISWIFSPRNDGHKNRLILDGETVEPPRVKVRLCEKI